MLKKTSKGKKVACLPICVFILFICFLCLFVCETRCFYAHKKHLRRKKSLVWRYVLFMPFMLFMRVKTSEWKSLVCILCFLFVLFVLFVRVKNIWVKVVYLHFLVLLVLFVLFVCIKDIWAKVAYLRLLVLFVLFVCVNFFRKKKYNCLNTLIYITTHIWFWNPMILAFTSESSLPVANTHPKVSSAGYSYSLSFCMHFHGLTI